MVYSKILIPLDGSPLAEAALSHVLNFAAPPTKIHLLSVITDHSAAEMAVLQTAIGHPVGVDASHNWVYKQENIGNGEIAERERYLKQTAARLESLGFLVSVEVDVGDAAEAINDCIKNGFDLVVMATHQRTGFSKLLLGSVAEQVVRHAPCPVVIIPARAQEHENAEKK